MKFHRANAHADGRSGITLTSVLFAVLTLVSSGCEQRTGHESSYFNAPYAVLEPTSFGLQQEMAFQPSYRPLRPSQFFTDHQASRPLEPGVVARGQLDPDPAERRVLDAIRHSLEQEKKSATDIEVRLHQYRTGRFPGTQDSMASASARAGVRPGEAVMTEVADMDGGFIAAFPVPVDEAFVRRGQERYTIFCAMCHGAGGAGNGMIVQRGYLKPPSYLTDVSRGYKLRGEKMSLSDAPVGYLFDVITHGYGGMPDYSTQIPVRDRWAIVAYVRALQMSRLVKIDELPAETQQQAREQIAAAAAEAGSTGESHTVPHQEAPK
jgi:mono/diheme cytochrome c family protein